MSDSRRKLHALGGRGADMRQLASLRGHHLDVIERDCGGNVLHQVEDVVHRGDQLVDFVAVERRDESLVQQIDGFVRELVCSLFGLLHVLLMDLGVLQIVDQQLEFVARGNNALCVRVEDFKELALGGHESTEHWNPGNWSHCD
jgi:hypothetical protein